MLCNTKKAKMKQSSSSKLHSFKPNPLIPLYRAHMLVYSSAIAALFCNHLTSTLTSPSLLSFLLFFSDAIFAFMWAACQAFRWRPGRREESLVAVDDLPRLDVFVCTADASKEPPMSVANTVLSAMAFEYLADRLSVYVSDDGCSELTLFAFVEAARFARRWLPFCKEKKIRRRYPKLYFQENKDGDCEFKQIKEVYERMEERVEKVMEQGRVTEEDMLDSLEDNEIFGEWKKGFTRRDHPTIIQVLLESSRDKDAGGSPLPNLIYISREKSSVSPHHYKAGALNVLIRVSGVLTGAPMILTLDCDMYSNDPQSPRRAMCYFSDPELSPNLAFVQFPQRFRGLNKNDIYGGEMKGLFQMNSRGMDGLRGPNYVGTGCFLLRRAFYGQPASPVPEEEEEVVDGSVRLESLMTKAYKVASCAYENGTKWGSEVGCRYGSLVEDYYTSYHLHCEGWRSVFCDPDPPAFLGDAPASLNDALSQTKRWCVGLLEVSLSRYCPLIYGTRRTSLAVALAYSYYAFWGFWCIPIAVYGLLPQLALVTHKRLFPKVSEPWFFLHAYLFMAAYMQDLIDFILANGTFFRWWSDQRMWMIKGVTCLLFGSAEFVLQKLGVSTTGFNVTSKVLHEEQAQTYDNGVFEFGVSSPFFFSLGFVAIVNLISFIVGIAELVTRRICLDDMFLQLFLSGFIVANSWPVYEGMFLRKDAGRIPWRITCSATFLAVLLTCISRFVFDG